MSISEYVKADEVGGWAGGTVLRRALVRDNGKDRLMVAGGR